MDFLSVVSFSIFDGIGHGHPHILGMTFTTTTRDQLRGDQLDNANREQLKIDLSGHEQLLPSPDPV